MACFLILLNSNKMSNLYSYQTTKPNGLHFQNHGKNAMDFAHISSPREPHILRHISTRYPFIKMKVGSSTVFKAKLQKPKKKKKHIKTK